MTLPRMSVAENEQEQPQQPLPIVRVCWDELINFLKSWFGKPVSNRTQTLILTINRYSGNSAQYQDVVSWKVPTDAEGLLKDICIVCSDYSPLKVWIRVGTVDQKDKEIQAPLNIPFTDLKLKPTTEVFVKCKSDGTTVIDFDAMINAVELRG